MNHYYFSECKANEKASDIAIHLYTVPLSNPHEKYSYAHSIAYELRKLNSYIAYGKNNFGKIIKERIRESL